MQHALVIHRQRMVGQSNLLPGFVQLNCKPRSLQCDKRQGWQHFALNLMQQRNAADNSIGIGTHGDHPCWCALIENRQRQSYILPGLRWPSQTFLPSGAGKLFLKGAASRCTTIGQGCCGQHILVSQGLCKRVITAARFRKQNIKSHNLRASCQQVVVDQGVNVPVVRPGANLGGQVRH